MPVLAVDTEFLREKTYYPKLCLVQVSTGEEIAAIDPLSIDDLSPLVRLFEDPKIVKVIHACSQDLEVLLYGMHCACAPVFDTQLAAAFLGMRQQASYASVVEHYMGVHLPKTESLTDWSRRPLDSEQLVYAEDDVRYLPDIYRCMYERLMKTNRLGWLIRLRKISNAIPKKHTCTSNDQTHSQDVKWRLPEKFVPGEKNVRLSTTFHESGLSRTKRLLRYAKDLPQRLSVLKESEARNRFHKNRLRAFLPPLKWAGAFRQKSVLSLNITAVPQQDQKAFLSSCMPW